MIPFRYTSHEPISNLPKLLKAYNSRGGSIIEFQRVVSFFFFSRKSSHYVWVPPNGSYALRSLPDTLTTLLFGWWSLSGFLWTIQVLITNLGGGRDATQELLDATGGGNAELARRVIDEENRARRHESVRAVLLFVGIIGSAVLFWWLTITVTDWRTRRRNRSQAVPTQVHAREPAKSPNAIGTAPIPSRTDVHLQAIFYNTNGSSTAIIDRTTVLVGEHIGGYTVLAIQPQSVTVKSASGQQKILRLSNGGQ